MAGELKSAVFRKEREETWRELDRLISRIEKKGLRQLTPRETLQLPLLYRQTLSSLSVARATSLDAGMLAYLEALAARAYLAIYGVNRGFLKSLGTILLNDLPRAIREGAPFILAAAGLFLFGTLVAYFLVRDNPDWFYSFISAEWAAGRTPDATYAQLLDSIYGSSHKRTSQLQIFTSFLFSNNAGVALLSFALGFALGIPTMLLLFTNGLMLGAFIAIFAEAGIGVDFGAWLTVHGTTEILALAICGGGGLMIGHAAAFPNQRSRLDNLARRGRTAARMLMTGVIMLFVAAFLEGYARQLVQDMNERYLIGLVMLAFWLAWFSLGGRGRSGHGG
jgi:uncharacterized membrane protein SpoIIM required for sporulation